MSETYFWNGVGTLGPNIKKGDEIPADMVDARFEEWLKDGTVTTSVPDMSKQLKDETELLKMEIVELQEKNTALKGVSKKLVDSETENEKLKKKNEHLEKVYSSIKQQVSRVVDQVVAKLQDDSMSRKEKDEAAKLLKGLL